VAEVELAHDLGLEVLVTDHHQASDDLPGCTILHPSIDGYPFEHLCGTAVAWKLATALRAAPAPLPDLDLVALATVADMVPLVVRTALSSSKAWPPCAWPSAPASEP